MYNKRGQGRTQRTLYRAKQAREARLKFLICPIAPPALGQKLGTSLNEKTGGTARAAAIDRRSRRSPAALRRETLARAAGPRAARRSFRQADVFGHGATAAGRDDDFPSL
ncbi:hypothetical protein EVAR_49401_1 [Eumeta japonica]|uniref:Uncharacterized protein n=1 Tax=Eumeta variegata TaxID=151549 RepID=A0A4C1Y6S6_EUMVA|nr:hypothetical protein EVAR_49401_1 [Eumeta japonica]